MDTDKIYAEAIVNEYSKKIASKVVALKKLDRAAKRPFEIFAYTFGIISTLIMGTGMSLAMKVIGDGGVLCMALGIIVGILGMVGIGINYPIYKKILQKNKDKYASDILRLANEITNESEQ
ncbi:MAG: dihydropteridine reductase [Clostridia bacterium]|nr:dihydropteridine reductase [Clostridia bacterium]MDY5264058.1 dihydropteridine reductase [Eubacteriales bacterium]